MSQQYTILFAPIDGVGHFNANIGIAEQLRDRGHKVVFATPMSWKGKLEAHGFVEEIYSNSHSENVKEKKDEFNDIWGEMVSKMAPAMTESAEYQMEHLSPPMLKEGLKQFKFCEPQYKKIMEKVQPDLVVVDTVFQSPSLVNTGVPWILVASMTPLAIFDNVPPPFLGLPTEGDKSSWKKLSEKQYNVAKDMFDDFKDWVIQNGGPELKYRHPFLHEFSPYANIYMYPIELDYSMFSPCPPNWHRFDAFVRSTSETFEIPEKLKNLSGKLIYLSMGTIGCSELGLMKRLVGILGKSPHRFIVSKGPLADKYDLPENMWGAKSVPQTKVIPLVDLVITHGGNNTITESFYFGKRVLVLPLFGDQWDNAQRIYETGLGLKFLPYKVTESELLSGVEYLLKDEMLERRMNSISQRIQSSNSQSAAADLVESVVRNNVIPRKKE